MWAHSCIYLLKYFCCWKFSDCDNLQDYGNFYSLKEESEQTVCGESLEKKNSETAQAVATLPNKFKTIDSYISILISK